jgi:hypothetical protein
LGPVLQHHDRAQEILAKAKRSKKNMMLAKKANARALFSGIA